MKRFLIEEMTPQEITDALKEVDTETSMMLACRPDLVDMKKAVKDETYDKLVNVLTGGKPKNRPEVYVPFSKWSKNRFNGRRNQGIKD